MSKPAVYTNCKILDGTRDMVLQENKAIVVQDGRIAAIVDAKDAPKHAATEDLKGAYVLPGLINLHAHLPGSGKPMNFGSSTAGAITFLKKLAIGRFVMRQLTYKNAKEEFYGGVTTVRAVGGLVNADTAVRDWIASGKKIGPRILAANEAVSVPHGHMVGTVARAAESVEEAVAMVEDVAGQNPDLIKLMITGGVLDAPDVGEPVLRMPPEYVRACCDKAHELGFQVAAHVESTEGVKVALENGVDTVEHGAELSPELVRLFQDRNAADICTISPLVPLIVYGEEILKNPMYVENSVIVGRGIVRGAREALRSGIALGLGNDVGCPYITHREYWRELFYFNRWVTFDPKLTLHIATLGNAKIVGIDGETGSLEPGKCADFLAVKDNPLEDLRALRNPVLVVARGNAVHNPPYNVPKETQDLLDKCLDAELPGNLEAQFELE